jgi:endonuclease/exonuclease/phosphatase family metal-dependent hydrolase
MKNKTTKKLIIIGLMHLLSNSAYSSCTDDNDSTLNNSNNLNIMTYNLNGLPDAITKVKKYKDFESKKNRLANMCEFLQNSNIDTVMFQEVWLKKDAEALADLCGYKYVCYQDNENFQSGLMILSNHYISSCSKTVFQDRIPNSGVGATIDKKISRGFLTADIMLPNGQEFVLINTHTISNYKPQLEDEPNNALRFKQDPNEEVRRSQLAEIFESVSSIDKPIVIGGDLNTGPEYPLWDTVKNMASNRGYADDGNYESTFSNTNKYVIENEGSLDHFFVKNVIINRSIVLAEDSKIAESSDHYAKIIDVSICCDPNTKTASK